MTWAVDAPPADVPNDSEPIETMDSAPTDNEISDDESDCESDDDDEIFAETDINARLRQAQFAEPGWRRIIRFLDGDESDANARLRKLSTQYVLRNRILHKIVDVRGTKRLAIVVPLSLRATVLYRAHDSPMAGHQGAARLLRRIESHYFWKGMRDEIRLYVASCVTCGIMKASTRKPMGEMIPLPSSENPFETVEIDKFGAIQNSPDGFQYVLVLVDTCTRFIIAEAVKDATAETAAKFMTKVILQHHPTRVQSDWGSEFKREFEQVLHSHGINYVHSTPRHPKSNGMVERANQSLSQLMRTIISEKNHSDWVEVLPFAVHAYNTSVHDVTKFSPYFLLYGTEPRLGNLLGETVAPQVPRNPPDVIACRKLAAMRTDKHRQVQKLRYDKHRKPVEIQVGDLVLVETETQVKGQSRRFAPRRRGPFLVTEVYDNNTIRIQGESQDTARINVERCIRLQRRPADLQFDDGLAGTIDSVVRGPDLFKEGGQSSNENAASNFDSAHNFEKRNSTESDSGEHRNSPEAGDDCVERLVPVRRSLRVRHRPERLIETMIVRSDDLVTGPENAPKAASS